MAAPLKTLLAIIDNQWLADEFHRIASGLLQAEQFPPYHFQAVPDEPLRCDFALICFYELMKETRQQAINTTALFHLEILRFQQMAV